MTIDKILQAGIKRGASDIHLYVGTKPCARIEGELVELTEFSEVDKKMGEEIIFGILTEEQKERFLKERELDFSYQTPDLSRFRVNIHFEKDVLGLVARIISQVSTMEELGLPEILHEMTGLSSGLIIVTGPSGCGKSTTLAAMIDEINKERRANIITLEDPIEFLHKRINSIVKQRQLGRDVLSFAEGLKRALRQDPNVIMVGEMRDPETISATITAAETGHLVLATLHTNNAAQTIDRIIDVFPPYQQNQIRLQLSMVLKCIIAQKLLPKIGGGRMAIWEILINTPAIANLIREGKTAQIKNVIQTSSEFGMVSLDQALGKAYKDGLIAKESALDYIEDSKFLE